MSTNNDLAIINTKTGEIYPIPVYEAKQDRWERVYAKTLVDMLNITSESKTQVIAYLIKNKDYNNVVMAPIKKISEETGCSSKTVQRTLALLEENKFISRLQRGVVMFSPHVMRSGRNDQGMAVLRRWQDQEELK